MNDWFWAHYESTLWVFFLGCNRRSRKRGREEKTEGEREKVGQKGNYGERKTKILSALVQ